MIKCHYNWKYIFLRPSIDQIIKRYLAKLEVSQGGVNGICRADRCAVRLGEVRVVDRRAGLRADRRADRRANGPCSHSDGRSLAWLNYACSRRDSC